MKPHLPCQPEHAARPIALCHTKSGSGWWLHHIGPEGQIHTGEEHIRYPTPAHTGRQVMIRHHYTNAPILLTWHDAHLHVHTEYADGKTYSFDISPEDQTKFLAW